MLEDKIEELTKEVVLLRKAIEANGLSVSGGAKSEDAGGAKPAAAKKPAAKKPAAKKAVEPDHDADEVGAIMRKAAKEVDKAAVQKYIGGQDCTDLADLLTKPELFDDAYAFAEELLSGGDEEEGEEEDEI